MIPLHHPSLNVANHFAPDVRVSRRRSHLSIQTLLRLQRPRTVSKGTNMKGKRGPTPVCCRRRAESSACFPGALRPSARPSGQVGVRRPLPFPQAASCSCTPPTCRVGVLDFPYRGNQNSGHVPWECAKAVGKCLDWGYSYRLRSVRVKQEACFAITNHRALETATSTNGGRCLGWLPIRERPDAAAAMPVAGHQGSSASVRSRLFWRRRPSFPGRTA